MSLPRSTIKTETLTIGDDKVEVRGLTRGEVAKIQQFTSDLNEMEIHILSFGTDTPLDEARVWHPNASAGDVERIISTIQRLSGLNAEVPKG